MSTYHQLPAEGPGKPRSCIPPFLPVTCMVFPSVRWQASSIGLSPLCTGLSTSPLRSCGLTTALYPPVALPRLTLDTLQG